MNILVVDVQGILSEKQSDYAKNRLYFCLAKFSEQVDGATMHFSVDDGSQQVNCSINVSIDGSEIITVNQVSISYDKAMNFAIDALEPRIAGRIKWQSWIDARAISGWIISMGRSLKRRFGLQPRKAIRKATIYTFEKQDPHPSIGSNQTPMSRPIIELAAKRPEPCPIQTGDSNRWK